MKLTQKQKLHKTVRWLRKTFPADLPVYTKHTILPKDGDYQIYGDTDRKPTYYLIRFHKSAKYATLIDTIWHEWAHVLTWFAAKYEEHPNEFGEAYARIYRAWLKWDFGRGDK